MPYKSILVHTDNSKSCRKRLDAAVVLAEKFDAHLTGIYVIPPLPTAAFSEGSASAALIETLLDDGKRQCTEAANMFRQTVESTGLRTEWCVEEGPVAEHLTLHAHYADLVVAGQEDPEDADSTANALIAQMILSSGRPALVIPYIGTQQTLGERIVVAWNGQRESVRAVNDSLPLLQGAKNVDVIAINAPLREGNIPCAEICTQLARHSVQAVAQESTGQDIDVVAEILSRAADYQSDLIVMGAYGHSRFRELVFGGATRGIFAHMTVPVFMSH